MVFHKIKMAAFLKNAEAFGVKRPVVFLKRLGVEVYDWCKMFHHLFLTEIYLVTSSV